MNVKTHVATEVAAACTAGRVRYTIDLCIQNEWQLFYRKTQNTNKKKTPFRTKLTRFMNDLAFNNNNNNSEK